MKIAPFILFLILLITLVVSMLFGDSLLNKREGFVSFGYTNTDAVKVNIPQYGSKQVTYLYDNLYFDGTNGNIVEVNSSFCGSVRVPTGTSGNVTCNDSTGTSIQNIYIKTRSQAEKIYPKETTTVSESSLAIQPLNTHLSYLTQCPTISSTPGFKYQVFYASWENDTYMHILGLNPTESNGQHIQSFYYNYDSASMKYIPLNTPLPPYKQTYTSNDDSNNGKLYKDSVYNQPNIYQISKYVKYDLVRGCILVLNPTSNTYNVYSRTTGQPIQDGAIAGITNLSSLVSWIIPDNNNGHIIVMAHGMNTLIMIVNPDPSDKKYILSYCVRFTDKEVHLSSSSSGNIGIVPETPPDSSNNTAPCNDELSCKWYYYFKTIGNDTSVLFNNDFIRKTQIVPPVCPTCPNCTGSGVCTDCGGKGGSGTKKDENGNTIKDAVSGTVGLGKDAVTGTVGLGKDAVTGTVGLGKDAVTGTVGLGKEIVGGAVGIVKDTASGIYNLGKGGKGEDKEKGTDSTVNGSTDQYSYYGALQSKGANYMPVTADFSAFSR